MIPKCPLIDDQEVKCLRGDVGIAAALRAAGGGRDAVVFEPGVNEFERFWMWRDKLSDLPLG